LWIPSFIVHTNFEGTSLPFYKLLAWLAGNNYYLLMVAAFLIIIFSALIINNLCSENGISAKVSLLGGFLFIVVASALTFYTGMSPFIWANLLLLLLLRLLYLFPSSTNHIVLSYNAGFLAGVASLFFTQLFLFIVVIWMAFLIHRSGSWRNYFVALTGALTPVLFLFTWYFWNDQTDMIVTLILGFFDFPGFIAFLQMNKLDIALLIILTVLVIFSVFRSVPQLRKKNINLRRNLQITLYFFIFSVLIIFLTGKVNSFQLIVIPSSIILVHTLSNLKKGRWANIVLTVFISLIIVNQFMKLLVLF
jgi:hypothetical protein